jgi:FkbM family methyltransferase
VDVFGLLKNNWNMKIKNQNKLKEKVIKKILGLTYRLDNSANGFYDKNGEGDFLNKFVDYTKKESPVVFDVGANIGEYSEILVDKFNKLKYSIHLFEPQKSCCEDLQKKFNKNNQVVINNFGLSNKEDIVVIYKDTEKSALTSLYKRNLDFYDLHMNIEEKIEIKRADQYIESHNVKHIHLLKVDVEGHELAAFDGFGEYLNADFIDFIQFEYGGTNLDSHTNLIDFYTLFESKGFKICKIMKKNLEYRKYNPRFENFIYQNYVAVSSNVFDKLMVQ